MFPSIFSRVQITGVESPLLGYFQQLLQQGMSPWGRPNRAQPQRATQAWASVGSLAGSCAAWISSSRVQSLVANTGYMTFCSTCPLLAIKKTAGLTHFHIGFTFQIQSLSLFFIPFMVLPKMGFQKLWWWWIFSVFTPFKNSYSKNTPLVLNQKTRAVYWSLLLTRLL